jgi:hypothetical protein
MHRRPGPRRRDRDRHRVQHEPLVARGERAHGVTLRA